MTDSQSNRQPSWPITVLKTIVTYILTITYIYILYIYDYDKDDQYNRK